MDATSPKFNEFLIKNLALIKKRKSDSLSLKAFCKEAAKINNTDIDNIFINWVKGNPFLFELLDRSHLMLSAQANKEIDEYLHRNKESKEEQERLISTWKKVESDLDDKLKIYISKVEKKDTESNEIFNLIFDYLAKVKLISKKISAIESFLQIQESSFIIAVDVYKNNMERLNRLFTTLNTKMLKDNIFKFIESFSLHLLLTISSKQGELFYRSRDIIAKLYWNTLASLQNESYLNSFLLFLFFRKQSQIPLSSDEEMETLKASKMIYPYLKIETDENRERIIELIASDGLQNFFNLVNLSCQYMGESYLIDIDNKNLLHLPNFFSFLRGFLKSYLPPLLSQAESQQLFEVLQSYEKEANRNPDILRSRIPAREIWRYFVDGINQTLGRNIRNTSLFINKQRGFFNSRERIFDLSINDYLKRVERCEKLDNDAYLNSQLGKLLDAYGFQLTEEMRTHLTLNDLLGLDKGWPPFELTEKGYFTALFAAFDMLFKKKNEELSVELIIELHKKAIDSVRNTNYLDEEFNGFRNSGIEFGIISANCTRKGLLEYLRRNDSNSGLVMHHPSVNPDGSINLNDQDEKCNFLPHTHLGMTPPSSSPMPKQAEKVMLSLKNTNNESHYTDKFFKYFLNGKNYSYEFKFNKNNFNYKFAFYSYWHARPFSMQKQNVIKKELAKILIENRLRILTKRFNVDIKQAATFEKKLFLIVCYIQDCEQLHPFRDANCRTFCMLLLNFLLIQNGFPLSLLKNPNCFDLFSRHELVIEVIHGMNRTLALVNGEENLFEFNVSHMARFLEKKPFLRKTFLEPFHRLVETEEGHREAAITQRVGFGTPLSRQ